ncbi:MAG: methyltransferase domain-containing protein [Bacteroidetes bacterium]|nr:methyltransferase domain-containing protein [Bacteroidota bacterium]
MDKKQSEQSQAFWEDRWQSENTGWDIGYPSPPIAQYVSQYPNKDAAVLVAGCGNAHEAEYLLEQGFQNITLIDIAPTAVKRLQEKFSSSSAIKVVCADFFEHLGQYDLMIEQTFFCAIPPQRRADYARHAASLLRQKGKLIGLLFDIVFEKEGPPFGGSAAEYRSLFEPYFEIITMEACYNSIPPRAGSELFIQFSKK